MFEAVASTSCCRGDWGEDCNKRNSWAVFAALCLHSRPCEQAISNTEPAVTGIQNIFIASHREGLLCLRGVLGLAELNREQICWSVSFLYGRSGKGCCCGKKADEEDNQEKALPWLCVRTSCSPVLLHFQSACCLYQWRKADFKEELLKLPASSVCPVRVSIGRGEHPWDAKGTCAPAQLSFWVVKQLVVSKALNSRGAEPASATSCLVMSVGLLTSLFCLARLTSTGAGHNCPWWISAAKECWMSQCKQGVQEAELWCVPAYVRWASGFSSLSALCSTGRLWSIKWECCFGNPLWENQCACLWTRS